MASMGFSRLEHSSFGKSDKRYRPGLLAEHAVYISRFSASDRCVAINFSKNTHAFRREVAQYEESVTRKNARLADKLIINLDNRMDAEAVDDALRAFGISLSKGLARFRADIHVNDPNNLHAHVLFVDQSVVDGKKIAYLSDSPRDRAKKGLPPNGTQWLRDQWEKDCNAVLDAHGYDFRVDMRSRLDRGLDAPAEHIEWRKTEVEAPQSPEVPLDQEQEEQAPTGQEEPMVIQRDGFVEPHQRVKDAIDHRLQLRYLYFIREKVAFHETGMALALAEKERLSGEARGHFSAATEEAKEAHRTGEALVEYTKPDGRLKGITVKVPFIDYEWKSPKRRAGERLQKEKSDHERQQLFETSAAEEKAYLADVQKNLEEENRAAYEDHKKTLDGLVARHGDKATLETAEKVLLASVEEPLTHLTYDQVFAEFEIGNISADEALEALQLMGAPAEYLERVLQRTAIEEEMDPRGAYANDNEIEL